MQIEVGVSATDADGRRVQVTRRATGFEVDFAGDGAAVVALDNWVATLAHLERVRSLVDAAEATYAQLLSGGWSQSAVDSCAVDGGVTPVTSASASETQIDGPAPGTARRQAGDQNGATAQVAAEPVRPASGDNTRRAAERNRAQVAALAAEGLAPSEIAQALHLGDSTVYGHLKALRTAAGAPEPFRGNGGRSQESGGRSQASAPSTGGPSTGSGNGHGA